MNPQQNIHLNNNNNNNNNDNNNNNNNNINIIDQYAAAGGSSSVGEHGSGLVNRITALNSNRYSNFDRKTLTWTRVEPSSRCLPPSRSGAASVVVKGRLYMFGGYGGGTGRLDDFYSFSFDTNTWEEVQVLSAEKPGCRENNGVVIGDASRVYLFGGYNGNSWLNDLWMFDIETQRWTCIQESSDPNPIPADNAALGDLHVQGGMNHNENNNQILPRGSGGVVPSRRFGYVSVVHNNKFVLFGGFDGSRWLNDMYEFDFLTKTWRQIQARGQLPSVRSCPAWAKDDTHVYIQGGYDGVERKADFFACDLATYTWIEMPSRGTPPSPRYFHSCCLYGNKMYTYGGYSGSERLADMYAYDFETNVWSEVDCSSGDCPSGRSSLVAQVYGSCLYIFGGYNGITVLNDFYKFRLKSVSVPPPSLVSDLSRLINHPELSDVTFLVEGREIQANRSILAVRSEYFRILLYNGGMKESIQSHESAIAGAGPGYRPPIELREVSYPVFSKVLEYLYTDNVTGITLDLGIPLLIMSERFMLDRLKGLCEDRLRRELTVENVIGIFLASHQHNATGLKEIALEFILQHLKDPCLFDALAELKPEPDLLIEIISRCNSPFGAPTQQSILHRSTPSNGPFGGSSEWSGTRR